MKTIEIIVRVLIWVVFIELVLRACYLSIPKLLGKGTRAIIEGFRFGFGPALPVESHKKITNPTQSASPPKKIEWWRKIKWEGVPSATLQ